MHAEFTELRNQGNRGKVARGEIESVFCAVGTEKSAAGLLAASAVSARAAKPRREQAGSRKTCAKCAVNKDFEFNRRFFRDQFEFIHRDLPFQNHPFCAHLRKHCDGFRIMKRHLRGGKNRQPWKELADHPEHSGVLNDQSVGTERIQFGERMRGILDLRLLDQRIEGDINPASDFPRIGNQAGHVVARKVVAAFPRIEFFHSAVNGVRASVKRGERDGKRARGGKKFNRIRHEEYFL